MSLVNELKERILAGGEISREEALQLFEEPVEEVAQAADEIRENSAATASISVRSSTARAEDVLKTANSAPRAPTTIQDALKYTTCCRQKIS